MKQEWKQDVRHNKLLPSSVVLSCPLFSAVTQLLNPIWGREDYFQTKHKYGYKFCSFTSENSKWLQMGKMLLRFEIP